MWLVINYCSFLLGFYSFFCLNISFIHLIINYVCSWNILNSFYYLFFPSWLEAWGIWKLSFFIKSLGQNLIWKIDASVTFYQQSHTHFQTHSIRLKKTNMIIRKLTLSDWDLQVSRCIKNYVTSFKTKSSFHLICSLVNLFWQHSQCTIFLEIIIRLESFVSATT